jgi:hypothetical protein
LREHSERLAKERLARELATGRERQQELALAEAALHEAVAKDPLADGAATAADLARREEFLERRRRERAESASRLEAQERRIAAQASAAAEAATAHAVLERLRERRLSEHVRRERRQGQAAALEATLLRAGRDRGETA